VSLPLFVDFHANVKIHQFFLTLYTLDTDSLQLTVHVVTPVKTILFDEHVIK